MNLNNRYVISAWAKSKKEYKDDNSILLTRLKERRSKIRNKNKIDK